MLDRLFGRLLDALADRVALRLRAPITHDGSPIDGTAIAAALSDLERRTRFTPTTLHVNGVDITTTPVSRAVLRKLTSTQAYRR